MPAYHIANFSSRDRYRNQPAPRWILSIGTYGTTHVMVFAKYLEDALEEAAEWILENAPGHIMTEDSPELAALRKEACDEAGLAWPPPDDCDYEEDGYFEAFHEAQADLTYTESGYITSYEWSITAEPYNCAEVAREMRRDRKARGY